MFRRGVSIVLIVHAESGARICLLSFYRTHFKGLLVFCLGICFAHVCRNFESHGVGFKHKKLIKFCNKIIKSGK